LDPRARMAKNRTRRSGKVHRAQARPDSILGCLL
jgi:hypothetical protein